MNITIEQNDNGFLTEYDKKDIMNYIMISYENRHFIKSKAKNKASTIGFDSNKITLELLNMYGDNNAVKAFIKYYIFKILGYKIESLKQWYIYKTYCIVKIHNKDIEKINCDTKYTDVVKQYAVNKKAIETLLSDFFEAFHLKYKGNNFYNEQLSFKKHLANLFYSLVTNDYDTRPYINKIKKIIYNRKHLKQFQNEVYFLPTNEV